METNAATPNGPSEMESCEGFKHHAEPGERDRAVQVIPTEVHEVIEVEANLLPTDDLLGGPHLGPKSHRRFHGIILPQQSEVNR